jgi:hypothetical protein
MRCPRCGSEKLAAIINADVQVPVEGPDRLHLSTTGVGSVTFMDAEFGESDHPVRLNPTRRIG